MATKIDANMPNALDLVTGWTLRVTALDSSGNQVSAVKVGQVAITANTVVAGDGGGGGGGLATGQWFLVPGPNA